MKKYQLACIIIINILYCSLSFAAPKTIQDLTKMANTQEKTTVAYGNIPSLNILEFSTVSTAKLRLDNIEPVFIVLYPNDEVRIYPQNILVWHEVINENVHNKPYAVTYSPLTGSVVVYETNVNKNYLVLDNFGTLYNSNSILIDRNTGSLWSQFLGLAIEGQLLGKALQPVQSYWTTWKFAQKYYPNAKVLDRPRSTNRAYGRDPYGSYLTTDNNYYNNDQIAFQLSNYDNRLRPKKNIIGIIENDFISAVDLDYAKEKKIINFYLGLTPLVAIYDAKLDIVRIFNRTVWDKEALFVMENDQIKDIYTKSEWNTLGKCIAGKLLNASLAEKYTMQSFWFAWSAFHPETELIPGPTQVPDEALIYNAIP